MTSQAIGTMSRVSQGMQFRRAFLWGLAPTILGLCSCRAPDLSLAVDPFLDHLEAETVQTVQLETETVQSETVQLEAETVPQPETESVRQVVFFEESPGSARESAQAEGFASTAQASQIKHVTFKLVEPSVRIETVGYNQPDRGILDVDRMESSERRADEYLFDGGDRSPPVHYSEFYRLGLDTEDTVAEYVDHLGKSHVKPSNRVVIYAPRFGAVRTVSLPASGVSVEKLASASDLTLGVGMRNRVATTHHSQRESTERVRVRSRASGLDAERILVGIDQHTLAASHTKLLNAFEELMFFKNGRLVQTEKARIAHAIQSAIVWTRKQYPVIVAKSDPAHELQASFKPQEFIGAEDERRTPGRLRIVKLADKTAAAPGDVITFTIRYDNLGDREVDQVRIIDNLTPRLEYVADSATSSRAGKLVVEDNAEGSLVLKFELSDPLPGHQGGVVTFKAQVR